MEETPMAVRTPEKLIEIRVHGRGGQGNVAAAELLAQAAFAAGRHVQAFPAFGAERTGAPVVAFVRIGDAPIRLRSQVYSPRDLIIQDRTLVARDADRIVAGLLPEGLVVINAAEVPAELAAALPDRARAIAIPATDVALELLGRPVPNTVLLGAYAGASETFPLAAAERAIRQRFPGELGERNVAAARRGHEIAFRMPVTIAPTRPPREARPVGPAVAAPLSLGLVAGPGTSAGPTGYHTGSWRTLRPVWDPAKCNNCNLCVVYCPESVVWQRGPRDYAADLAFCKGCGLCAEECQPKAITMVREDVLVAAEGAGR
jgi:pyruvate ferredoxin oxidoreductase gamma subunit